MQIAYAPTFKGARWVKCHGDSTAEVDSITKALHYTSQSITQAIWLRALIVTKNRSARNLDFLACSWPIICVHSR